MLWIINLTSFLSGNVDTFFLNTVLKMLKAHGKIVNIH